MEEIAAACAMQWSVELDRGLRSQKPGSQWEAILRLGPRLQQWSKEPAVSQLTASMFKMDQGQEQAFINVILVHLMEAFRTGDNFTRFCIVKIFLMEMKSRKRCSKPPYSRGLLTKQRVPNHIEILKRVKSVLGSGDYIARALAFWAIGCLSELAADSIDVQRLVFEAIHSPYEEEVYGALYAACCFCEISECFSSLALENLSVLTNAIETPPKTRIQAIHVFAHLHLSVSVSLKAFEIGKDLMLKMPLDDVVVAMLAALSTLASKSSIILVNQVELLLSYLCSDPRSIVQAICLKCLLRLAKMRAGKIGCEEKAMKIMIHILESIDTSLELKVLTAHTLKEVLPAVVGIADAAYLLRLLSILELNSSHLDWSRVQPFLQLLVDAVCYLEKLRPDVIRAADASLTVTSSIEELDENLKLLNRVALLICDQIALLGCHLVAESTLTNKSKDNEYCDHMMRTRGVFLRRLALKLVQGCCQVSFLVLDCLSSMLEAYLRKQKPEVTIFPQQCAENLPDSTINRSSIIQIICFCIKDSGIVSICDASEQSKVSTRLTELICSIMSSDASCHVLKYLIAILVELGGHLNLKNSEGVATKVQLMAGSLMKQDEYWSAYKTVKLAACNALWIGSDSIADHIIEKTQSEASHFWMKALSAVCRFESSIQTECLKRNAGNNNQQMHKVGISRDNVIRSLGKAIAEALFRIYEAETTLAAAVKLHRTFEFQRWLLSLRASFICTVTELLGLLGPLCIDFKVADAENISSLDNDESIKPFISSVLSLAKKSETLCTTLWNLAASFDLLRLSYMGIDNRSSNILSLAALGCSFLSFCTVFTLSDVQSAKQHSISGQDMGLTAAKVACDLYHRLYKANETECPELLPVMLKLGHAHGSLMTIGSISKLFPLQNKYLQFIRLEIREILHLQDDVDSRDESLSWILPAKGMHKLKTIIEEWLCLPWTLPEYYFCTRPRIGVEVFAEFIDSPQSSEVKILQQGCPVLLSLCLQIRNLEINSKVKIRKICCTVTVKSCERQTTVSKEFYSGWKLGWSPDKIWTEKEVSLIEELMKRVASPNDIMWQNRCEDVVDGLDSRISPQIILCDVSPKQQGFCSCLLDTTDISCGLMQIFVLAVCLDEEGNSWILPPLNDGPTFNVIPRTSV